MKNPVFKDYSRYYNLLYKDKNYQAETNYIDELIRKYSSQPVTTVLNLGCGTGKHDLFLAKKGYQITGVDLSDDMLDIARQSAIPGANFYQGDIRTLRLNKTFDAVISLFHVMSYQVTWQDLLDAFTTAKAHLNPGGIFIFDFWYGPGVLSDQPTERKKEAEDNELKITRYTTPVMHPNDNIVDVQFDVNITDKKTLQNFQLKETHRMRYLFLPELRQLLDTAGFTILTEEEWLSGQTPGLNSWNACIIAKI